LGIIQCCIFINTLEVIIRTCVMSSAHTHGAMEPHPAHAGKARKGRRTSPLFITSVGVLLLLKVKDVELLDA